MIYIAPWHSLSQRQRRIHITYMWRLISATSFTSCLPLFHYFGNTWALKLHFVAVIVLMNNSGLEILRIFVQLMWCMSVLNALRSTVVSSGDLMRNIASNLQVCEPLCFIQNKIGSFVCTALLDVTPKSAVQTKLIGFYTNEDICNANELSISFAEKCSPKIDDLARNRPRSTGELKRRLDVEDVLPLRFSRKKI